MLTHLEAEGDEKLPSKLNDMFTQQSNSRYQCERDWYLNIAFFLGYQYLFYNNRSKRLEHPQVPDWRVRLVFNYIKPIVISQVARLLKNKPTMSVIPSTEEESDMEASKIAEKVLEVAWRKQKIPNKLRQLALWFSITGTAFLRVEFDQDAGVPFDVEQEIKDELGNFTLDEFGSPMKETKSINLGELDVTVISPFEVYVDPMATSLEDAKWVMINKYRSREEIQTKWPEAAKKINFGQQEPSANNFYESTILNAFGTFSGGQDLGNQKSVQDGALVKEFIFRPDDGHKESTRIFMCGTTILEKYEDPDLLGGFPITKFDDIMVPGRFWSDGVVQDLRPLNKEYNRTRSQIVEIKNLMAKPKWKVPKGSGIKASSITSEPGEVLVYNGTMAPEPIRPPDIPQYVFEHASKILEDMQNISNVRSVAVRPPARITSGIAIAAMQEQDDSAFGPTAASFEASLEEVGKRMLYLIHKNYKEQRLMQIVGRDGQKEVFSFQGSSISGDFDVIVQAGSSLPRSKVAKQELIMRLAEGGWFGPVEDPNTRTRVLRLLEVGSTEDLGAQQMPPMLPPGMPPIDGVPSVPPGAPPMENAPMPRLGDMMAGNPEIQQMRTQQALARS